MNILVVDVDGAFRGGLCDLLRRSGYAVRETGDPVEALRLGERPDPPIHLLLTEVLMSRLGGIELAERLSTRHRGLKVLYVSTAMDRFVRRDAIGEAGSVYLQKPFPPEECLRKIFELIGLPAGPAGSSR